MMISTQADYDAAIERIQELSGCLEDTPEERGMIELVEAVEAWHARHDL